LVAPGAGRTREKVLGAPGAALGGWGIKCIITGLIELAAIKLSEWSFVLPYAEYARKIRLPAAWLLITGDPHSETRIPESFGALTEAPEFRGAWFRKLKQNFPANRKNN
jgi:hypothetical protein